MVRSLESLQAEYTARTPKSRAEWEKSRSVMPGGIIKGAYWKSPHPIYIVKAAGCNITDLDGNTYVDFENHHSTMILGHSHPNVVEALRKEIDRGIGLGHPTELDSQLAQEIVDRVPSIDKVRFTNSGTEASLHAVRLVRAASGKPKIAKFEGAYHGSHDALEHSTGAPVDKLGPADSPKAVPAHKGMSQGTQEEVVILPYSQPETVEMILREHKDEIAGVFYDGKPGMFEISDEFTHFVRKTTKELGMYMVMDEVVSFRSGRSGYQGMVGVEPDLTIFGKVVGGGMPAGAIGGKADLMDMLDNTGTPTGISQSGTFSGNNFTVAAGLATLRSLTPDVYDHIYELKDRLVVGLEKAFAKARIPVRVVGRGTMVNFYFTDKPIRDYRAFVSQDTELFNRISNAVLLKGYNLGGGQMTLMVSSPMNTEMIDGFLTAMGEVLEESDN